MPVTQPYTLYAAIETRLRTAATTAGALLDGVITSDYIYFTSAPDFSGGVMDETVIQIVPGAPQVPHRDQALGLVREEFSIVCWRRVYLDQAGRSSLRLHDAARGIAAVQLIVRRLFNQNELDGIVTIPIIWTRGSIPSESEDYPGWMMGQDYFSVGYEMIWPSSPIAESGVP